MKKKTGLIHRDPIVSAISEKREKNLAKVKELNSAFYKGVVNGLDTALKIIAKQKDVPIGNGTSDGAHTFGELYKQRAVMLSVVASLFPDRAWKTKLDHKGEAKTNRFIVGFDTPAGQSTFHCDIQKFWDKFDCPELPQAKPFDGHTSGDAVKRLESMKRVRHSITLDEFLDMMLRNYETVVIEVYRPTWSYPIDVYKIRPVMEGIQLIPNHILQLHVSEFIVNINGSLTIQVETEDSETSNII